MKENITTLIQYSTKSKGEIEQLKIKVEDTLTQSIYSQNLMENLINDLLDLAKLEVNKFKIEKSFFDPM